jgi:protein TonB
MFSPAFTNLRYPVALAAGGLLTTTLFWGLWSLTNKTFQYEVMNTVKIEFTRQRVVEDIVPKKRDRVEREPPPIDVELPPLSGATTGGIDTVSVPYADPVFELPGGGITVFGSDRDAIPLVRVEPTYPPRALQAGQEGWVKVQFDVSTSGAVTNVSAVESEPGQVFDAAAVNAVARWRYSPSVVEGTAVERVGMQTLIRFTLED